MAKCQYLILEGTFGELALFCRAKRELCGKQRNRGIPSRECYNQAKLVQP
jgi:hypothetical protein